MRNYLKYKDAGRAMTLSKNVDGRTFIQLNTFDPWTGAIVAPEIQEVDPRALQAYIDKLSSWLSSLQVLQADINTL